MNARLGDPDSESAALRKAPVRMTIRGMMSLVLSVAILCAGWAWGWGYLQGWEARRVTMYQ